MAADQEFQTPVFIVGSVDMNYGIDKGRSFVRIKRMILVHREWSAHFRCFGMKSGVVQFDVRTYKVRDRSSHDVIHDGSHVGLRVEMQVVQVGQ